MKSLADCRLYAFVDTGYLRGRSPADVARGLCDGGADLIQLRAKGEPVGTVLQWARELLTITEAAGVGLVVNDYLDAALQAGTPLCHLGQEDFFNAGFTHVRELRSLHPGSPPGSKGENRKSARSPTARIGLSTHAPAQAERAIAAGADYVAIGPVFATGTKPGAPPVTLDYVRWAANNVAIPWFAIGGINESNVRDVMAAGARRVCIVSAILNAPDIVKACQRFKEILMSARY